MKNRICVTLLIFTFLFYSFSTWAYFLKSKEKKEQIIYNEIKSTFSKKYANIDEEILNSEIVFEDIDSARAQISLIPDRYSNEKDDMNSKLDVLNEYLKTSEELSYYFDGNILKSNVTEEQIYLIKNKVSNLEFAEKDLLNNKIDSMFEQYNAIKELENAVDSLFIDNTREKFAKNLTYKSYEQANKLLNTVSQTDILDKESKDLDRVKSELDRIEKEKKLKIAKAWKKLNVPYISQNNAKVYNGCEIASLLMALKYKGYLKDMSLNNYAELVPKSTDPYKGFIYSIYDVEPRNVVHWIAPEPLVNFGIKSSGNKNIINATGYNLEKLEEEILNGNPVILYLTSDLKMTRYKVKDIPSNLHVVLLTGYNTITKESIITDPWTRENNRKTWTMSKSDLEQIYNAVGKKAVIVR